jgi:hypothetical protein
VASFDDRTAVKRLRLVLHTLWKETPQRKTALSTISGGRFGDEHAARPAGAESKRDRNLTDSEMLRWRSYFENQITRERDATAQLIANEHELMIEAVGGALVEIRRATPVRSWSCQIR